MAIMFIRQGITLNHIKFIKDMIFILNPLKRDHTESLYYNSKLDKRSSRVVLRQNQDSILGW